MKTESVSQVSFNSLYRGFSVSNMLKLDKSGNFRKELLATERLIRKNNIHKKDNVDVVINYSVNDGFYGVISPKKGETPNHPSYRCAIVNNTGAIEYMNAWAEAWNKAFSPERLKSFNNLVDFLHRGKLQ